MMKKDPVPPVDTSDGKRILAVDDNPDTAMILQVLLPADHHEVRVAHSGRSALEIADEFKPQIALLDLGLPDMSGHEVGRQLRTKNPDILLVAISGWGEPEDKKKSREAGFDIHLVKPVDIEMIRETLRKLINAS